MEMPDGDVPFRPRTGKAAAAPLLPEVEAYLQLLLVVHLTNNKRHTEVGPGGRAAMRTVPVNSEQGGNAQVFEFCRISQSVC